MGNERQGLPRSIDQNRMTEAQLAFAILLEHYGTPINAIDDYEDFKVRFITPLKIGRDFDIEIHPWKSPSLN